MYSFDRTQKQTDLPQVKLLNHERKQYEIHCSKWDHC